MLVLLSGVAFHCNKVLCRKSNGMCDNRSQGYINLFILLSELISFVSLSSIYMPILSLITIQTNLTRDDIRKPKVKLCVSFETGILAASHQAPFITFIPLTSSTAGVAAACPPRQPDRAAQHSARNGRGYCACFLLLSRYFISEV